MDADHVRVRPRADEFGLAVQVMACLGDRFAGLPTKADEMADRLEAIRRKKRPEKRPSIDCSVTPDEGIAR